MRKYNFNVWRRSSQFHCSEDLVWLGDIGDSDDDDDDGSDDSDDNVFLIRKQPLTN